MPLFFHRKGSKEDERVNLLGVLTGVAGADSPPYWFSISASCLLTLVHWFWSDLVVRSPILMLPQLMVRFFSRRWRMMWRRNSYCDKNVRRWHLLS